MVTIHIHQTHLKHYSKYLNFYYTKSCLPDEVDSFLIDNSYPFIVKPRFGHTSKNVYLVNNESQLYDSIEKCDRPIIQEYVGDSENEQPDTSENKDITASENDDPAKSEDEKPAVPRDGANENK